MSIIDFFKNLLQKNPLTLNKRIDYAAKINANIAQIYNLPVFLQLPERDSSILLGGEKFAQSIFNTPANETRDNCTYTEVLLGNIPNKFREFVEVVIKSDKHSLSYWVCPNYLAIGSDSDYMYFSMQGRKIKELIDRLTCMLPTKKMVDQIWKAADTKLAPRPIPPSSKMMSVGSFLQQQKLINKQLENKNYSLLAGHKKDTVIDKTLIGKPNNIAIYGWHQLSGQPIQQMNSSSHNIDYYDYSQGIRLVHQRAMLNGEMVSLYDVLKNPETSYLISDQGAYDARGIYL